MVLLSFKDHRSKDADELVLMKMPSGRYEVASMIDTASERIKISHDEFPNFESAFEDYLERVRDQVIRPLPVIDY
jgi:hypothetical protein